MPAGAASTSEAAGSRRIGSSFLPVAAVGFEDGDDLAEVRRDMLVHLGDRACPAASAAVMICRVALRWA